VGDGIGGNKKDSKKISALDALKLVAPKIHSDFIGENSDENESSSNKDNNSNTSKAIRSSKKKKISSEEDVNEMSKGVKRKAKQKLKDEEKARKLGQEEIITSEGNDGTEGVAKKRRKIKETTPEKNKNSKLPSLIGAAKQAHEVKVDDPILYEYPHLTKFHSPNNVRYIPISQLDFDIVQNEEPRSENHRVS
jgi:hypothetical protein